MPGNKYFAYSEMRDTTPEISEENIEKWNSNLKIVSRLFLKYNLYKLLISGSAGEILFPKLIKDEILKCDKNLIRAAKKASAIGGTMLLK